MPTITGLVLTHNEEDFIEECLTSIVWVDQIIVIDSESSDRTVEICRKFTDKIFIRPFDDFANQRNYGLEKIKTDWVLVIDADERVSKELKNEIIKTISNSSFEGYMIPRKNIFLNKWIKHGGWYPDYALRLFKNNKSRYTGKVHEHIRIEGTIGKLKQDLIHFTYRNIAHYLSKMNKYTTLWAAERHSQGRRTNFLWILLRPSLEFAKVYLAKWGFLSGAQGFIIARLSAYYQFLKYSKLWELQKKIATNSNN